MHTYLTALMLVATLGLVSCGGGNDVASSGTSAVSAAATTTTEPKVNGQVDERTGVAPVVAALTAWSPTANGGCGNSSSWGNIGTGPALTNTQVNACANALSNASNIQQCNGLGGYMKVPSCPECISIVVQNMGGGC
jgi:hypothetical protein